MMISRTVFVLACLATVSAANPAILRQFNKLINSDVCLKKCMDHLQEHDIELSLVKRTNVTDHLLNLELVCEMIGSARTCLDNCQVKSNPFALRSVNALCNRETKKIVDELQPCLTQHGRQINEECIKECGDYETFHEQVNEASAKLAKQPYFDAEAHSNFARMSNDACAMFKCSQRCTVLKTSATCPRLPDGNDAGGAVRYLIDLTLHTHRADLDGMRLTNIMATQTEPECNYLYAPEVMFDVQRDRMMVASLHAQQKKINEDIIAGRRPQFTTPSSLHHNHKEEVVVPMDQEADQVEKELHNILHTFEHPKHL
ncbi:unnamed protein product [Bursaphelenchus xylophilus]|uniref:(pine wood nematode) hypothetical protein n=1 Tax=Bursaphelenchus xylophilus TaxID=6326 RepID=A0A1I7RJ08_BURXY|nr:unnamed protein product [Bursaphelenchus xylophilus]CAG9119223.1 unnamed protein product [Bursaphelenchus xylophilus]